MGWHHPIGSSHSRDNSGGQPFSTIAGQEAEEEGDKQQQVTTNKQRERPRGQRRAEHRFTQLPPNRRADVKEEDGRRENHVGHHLQVLQLRQARP